MTERKIAKERNMNLYIDILIRTLVALIVLLILARIAGQRFISQLTFYDFVTAITVGSVSGAVCIDTSLDIWGAIMSMAIFVGAAVLTAILTSKSIWLRRIITGKPIMLISNGLILERGLKHSHYDINDLLRELRIQGYFDISEVSHAVLETSGQLSVLPKSCAKPVTASDLSIPVEKAGLLANVIIDGKTMHRNLHAMGKDESWLKKELAAKNAGEISEIFLATLDEKGTLGIYKKNHTRQLNSIFQ